MDLLTICLTWLAAFVGVLWKLEKKRVSALITPERLAILVDMARTAVAAAETAGNDQGWAGQDKYRLAAEGLVELAKRIGLTLSRDEVAVLIHAVLGELRSVPTA